MEKKSIKVGNTTVSICYCDITTLKTDVVVNSDDISGAEGQRFPDFIQVHPFDVIVPYETKIDREPEREAHVIRLTERELRNKALTKGWKNNQKRSFRKIEKSKG